MINFSIFKKGKKDADYHRQQVSERGILERIDKVLDEISEEGLKEIYELEERIKRIVNDPRTRGALENFIGTKEVTKEVKLTKPAPKQNDKKPKKVEPIDVTPKIDLGDIKEEFAETPIDEPVEEPAEVPTEETVEVAAEEPVEVPVEETVEETSQETMEIPVEEPKEEAKE